MGTILRPSFKKDLRIKFFEGNREKYLLKKLTLIKSVRFPVANFECEKKLVELKQYLKEINYSHKTTQAIKSFQEQKDSFLCDFWNDVSTATFTKCTERYRIHKINNSTFDLINLFTGGRTSRLPRLPYYAGKEES